MDMSRAPAPGLWDRRLFVVAVVVVVLDMTRCPIIEACNNCSGGCTVDTRAGRSPGGVVDQRAGLSIVLVSALQGSFVVVIVIIVIIFLLQA